MKLALWVPLAVLLLAAPARAQAPADTLAPHPVATGFAEQLAEWQRLQPRPAPPPSGDDPDAGIIRLQIDGLIVDETNTRIGADFYEAFYRMWSAPPRAVNFTVTIQEQLAPSLGTQIFVRVNDEMAFQAQLFPRAEVIEAAAAQAVALAQRMLQSRTAVSFGL